MPRPWTNEEIKPGTMIVWKSLVGINEKKHVTGTRPYPEAHFVVATRHFRHSYLDSIRIECGSWPGAYKTMDQRPAPNMLYIRKYTVYTPRVWPHILEDRNVDQSGPVWQRAFELVQKGLGVKELMLTMLRETSERTKDILELHEVFACMTARPPESLPIVVLEFLATVGDEPMHLYVRSSSDAILRTNAVPYQYWNTYMMTGKGDHDNDEECANPA